MSLTHGSLFSGIGGFDLAAEWAGWENAFHCELNPFCRSVLHHYWHNATSYEDITKADFSIWRGRIDVLTGGFPCQDASIAKQHGQGQLGLEGDRTGLWREMVRAIEEIRPRYVVAENVANILRTNNGRDWRAILNELARLGYNAEWRVTRASEVGAAHHRARVYLVAYPDSIRLDAYESFYAFIYTKVSQERRKSSGGFASVGISWASEPSVSGMDDGLPAQLDGISFSKWRNESIKAYGNAIVPQVAFQIFQAINQYEAINR